MGMTFLVCLCEVFLLLFQYFFLLYNDLLITCYKHITHDTLFKDFVHLIEII